MGTCESRTSRANNGAALVEFALVIPVYLMALFCFLQLALIIQARFMLTYAAFSAARAGIVYNAAPNEMVRNVARVLSPNYGRIQRGYPYFAQAYQKTLNEYYRGQIGIQVLAPANAQQRLYNATNLNILGPSERNLKVRVTWNFPMMIPLANTLFFAFIQNIPFPNWQGVQPGVYYGASRHPGHDPRIPLYADYQLRITTLNRNQPYHRPDPSFQGGWSWWWRTRWNSWRSRWSRW